MVKCCASNYESSSHKKIQGISFHRFPKDIALRQLWIVNMKRQTWKPKPNSLLCSKHFENKYLDTSKSCTNLRPGAVPTIFEQVSEDEQLCSPPIKRVKTLLPVLRDIQNVNLQNYNVSTMFDSNDPVHDLSHSHLLIKVIVKFYIDLRCKHKVKTLICPIEII